LKDLFEKALKFKFDAESNEVIIKVEEILRPYKISFGNRVLKQIEEFVKVYTACSGSHAERPNYVLEAIDSIVCSKIVHKLEVKQIMDVDALVKAFQKLKLSQCVEFLKSLSNAGGW